MRRGLWERRARFFSFLRDLPRVWPYLKPFRKLGASSVLLVGFASLAGVLSPWPLAILIDGVLGDKPLPSLLGPLLGSWTTTSILIFAVSAGLAMAAFENGIGVVQEYVNTKLDQLMALDLRSDIFWHLQRLSPDFHERTQVGGLMFTFTSQADSIGRIAVSFPALAQSIVTLVAMSLIAYQIDPQLALLSMTIVPFVYYATGYYTNRIGPRLVYVRNLEHQQFSLAQECFSMLRVVRAFGRERFEYTRVRQQGEEAVDARVDLTLRQTLFSLVVDVITAAGTALVLGFGAYHALQGKLTAGELLVVMSYVAAVYAPLQQISYTLTSLQDEFISLRAGLDLLETKPEIEDAPEAVNIGEADGAVAFEGVCFTYEEREQTLEDVTFKAAPGQRIGIVGPTGAGKTTLVNLISRLYDPQSGRILLDNRDIRDITIRSLREQLSIVLQDPLLFSGTIEANVRYGRLDASRQEIEDAARAANAHDFIAKLPQGYETELGERGMQLSVGERQRIGIARAFVRNAPILILDEPTSSVDSRTESIILDALDRLLVGRTSFVIAHRLSTVRDADLILVINEGRLVEAGTHDELIGRRGLYSELHDAQTGLRAAGPDEAHSRHGDDHLKQNGARALSLSPLMQLSQEILEREQATGAPEYSYAELAERLRRERGDPRQSPSRGTNEADSDGARTTRDGRR